MNTIPLGFEIGTGKPVAIPCRHMVVSGQTQEAGKTTTLEAMISRSGLTAIAFITKRGEQSFARARRIEPYFRERADWQFVCSILEATMRERMKFERNWIIKASKGAKTLADVQRNVRELLLTARGINEGVYTTLDAYLEIVVPRIASVNFATSVDLRPGLNVLDLSARDTFPPELQSLVMRSVLEWVYERCENTVVIIPEAWEFIPQGRGSPVKLAAIDLMRKGAGLRNYVWPDSQDIGGVDKEFLRQCPVWLLGVQREANEIARTLSNIPASIAKPKAAEIATLQLGQFFACWGNHVIKTYAQPEWMSAEEAKSISMGGEQKTFPVKMPKHKASARVFTKQTISPAEQSPLLTGTPTQKTEEQVTTKEANELKEENRKLRETIEEMKKAMRSAVQVHQISSPPPPPPRRGTALSGDEQDDLYNLLLERLLKEPAIIELRKSVPELNVTTTRETIEADGKSLRGRLAQLIHAGFFDSAKNANQARLEMIRLGRSFDPKGTYRECDNLAELGFLTKEKGGYQAVPGMKVNIIRS